MTKYLITNYPSTRARNKGRETEFSSFKALANYFSQPAIYPSTPETVEEIKDRLPAFVGGTANGRLNDSTMESLSLLVLDFDGAISINEVMERCRERKLQFVLYSSYRHLIDGTIEKFRVIVPLHKPIPVELYRALYKQAIIDIADNKNDKSRIAPSSLYFLPATRCKLGVNCRTWRFEVNTDGIALDWESLGLVAESVAPAQHSYVLDDDDGDTDFLPYKPIPKYAQRIIDGEHSYQSKSEADLALAVILLNSGYTYAQIIYTLETYHSKANRLAPKPAKQREYLERTLNKASSDKEEIEQVRAIIADVLCQIWRSKLNHSEKSVLEQIALRAKQVGKMEVYMSQAEIFVETGANPKSIHEAVQALTVDNKYLTPVSISSTYKDASIYRVETDWLEDEGSLQKVSTNHISINKSITVDIINRYLIDISNDINTFITKYLRCFYKPQSAMIYWHLNELGGMSLDEIAPYAKELGRGYGKRTVKDTLNGMLVARNGIPSPLVKLDGMFQVREYKRSEVLEMAQLVDEGRNDRLDKMQQKRKAAKSLPSRRTLKGARS